MSSDLLTMRRRGRLSSLLRGHRIANCAFVTPYKLYTLRIRDSGIAVRGMRLD